MKFLHFFLFCGLLLPSWIRIRMQRPISKIDAGTSRSGSTAQVLTNIIFFQDTPLREIANDTFLQVGPSILQLGMFTYNFFLQCLNFGGRYGEPASTTTLVLLNKTLDYFLGNPTIPGASQLVSGQETFPTSTIASSQSHVLPSQQYTYSVSNLVLVNVATPEFYTKSEVQDSDPHSNVDHFLRIETFANISSTFYKFGHKRI